MVVLAEFRGAAGAVHLERGELRAELMRDRPRAGVLRVDAVEEAALAEVRVEQHLLRAEHGRRDHARVLQRVHRLDVVLRRRPRFDQAVELVVVLEAGERRRRSACRPPTRGGPRLRRARPTRRRRGR